VKFSFIIPVYNRPGETRELLESLSLQEDSDFEVIVVEDGSSQRSEFVVEEFSKLLDIHYFFKDNSGPGPSRNFGCEKAKGDYFIFLDSDCIVPQTYVRLVRETLEGNYTDAFGGPDEAYRDFTNFQKAVSFSMTSFITTGGIRGGTERMGKFQPRSFNMGFSRKVYEVSGGFSSMRFGEDIDLSIRILELGFTTQLISQAFVYHKRRTNLRLFFKQVYNSGIARINLQQRHPGSLKLVHTLPALFLLSVMALLILAPLLSWYLTLPILAHLLLLFLSALWQSRNPIIAMLAILTSYTQLFAYGLGFLKAFWRRIILRSDEFSAFNENFYK
jgi:glycosyltransferase involved in cell wall biosynthesis